MPGPSLLAVPSVSESLEEEIRALPGIASIRKVKFFRTQASGQPIAVLAMDVFEADRIPLDLEVGNVRDVVAGMRDGGVVIGTNLGKRLQVGVGNTVDLETRRGVHRVKIVGTTTEYTSGGMALYAEWKTAKSLFAIKGVDVFCVEAQDNAPPALAAGLEGIAASHDVLLQSNADVKASIDRTVDGIIGFMWTILLLVFLVSSLGTVNTLTMNVIEQTREIGILRAVAMTRAQVKKVVRWQALLLALGSVLPGLVVGLGATLLLHFSNEPMTGLPVEYHLDPVIICVVCVVAPLTSILASWLPARRAARMPVIHALHRG
ncbi:MAG: hypothetical protein CMJ83_18515 [Planctomycetes bacterium]|nr:hypothetical protein [Planctomycetota bacterium]